MLEVEQYVKYLLNKQQGKEIYKQYTKRKDKAKRIK